MPGDSYYNKPMIVCRKTCGHKIILTNVTNINDKAYY